MTENGELNEFAEVISTHTSLAGRDDATFGQIALSTFLLTRPSRDVTDIVVTDDIVNIISTHTSLAGRDLSSLYDF